MIQPDYENFKDKVDCRYTLAVETAKRARQLVDGAQTLTDEVLSNPVSQAVKEIEEEKITYIRPEG